MMGGMGGVGSSLGFGIATVGRLPFFNALPNVTGGGARTRPAGMPAARRGGPVPVQRVRVARPAAKPAPRPVPRPAARRITGYRTETRRVAYRTPQGQTAYRNVTVRVPVYALNDDGDGMGLAGMTEGTRDLLLLGGLALGGIALFMALRKKDGGIKRRTETFV